MKRAWVLVWTILPVLLAMGGCLRAVEVNPEDVTPATVHHGNIRLVDKAGTVYVAQSVDMDEKGNYRLKMVKVIVDGVPDPEPEVVLPRANVVSVTYYETNRWLVGGLIVGTSAFFIWLYYKINTGVFD